MSNIPPEAHYIPTNKHCYLFPFTISRDILSQYASRGKSYTLI